MQKEEKLNYHNPLKSQNQVYNVDKSIPGFLIGVPGKRCNSLCMSLVQGEATPGCVYLAIKSEYRMQRIYTYWYKWLHKVQGKSEWGHKFFKYFLSQNPSWTFSGDLEMKHNPVPGALRAQETWFRPPLHHKLRVWLWASVSQLYRCRRHNKAFSYFSGGKIHDGKCIKDHEVPDSIITGAI